MGTLEAEIQGGDPGLKGLPMADRFIAEHCSFRNYARSRCWRSGRAGASIASAS